MRIAHFGTFDIANYGDLLFPLVAEHRLQKLNAEWIHVSPIGMAPGSRPLVWPDARPTVGLDRLDTLEADAVMLGGGNLFFSDRVRLDEYSGVREPYFALWAGAAATAGRLGVPFVVNATGGRGRFGPCSRILARSVLRRAAYAAVRDFATRDLLLPGTSPERLAVVPDTAFDVPAVWPARDFRSEDPWSGQLLPYVAVHVNRRYAPRRERDLAHTLDALATTLDARVTLVPIGPCHGDVEFACAVGDEMRSEPNVLAPPRSLREIAATIAGARAYVGSSMHGMVTALAYGVPPMLVADRAVHHKFEGMLSHVGAVDRLVGSWESVVDAASTLSVVSAGRVEEARRSLDVHWDRVADALVNGRPCRPSPVVRRWSTAGPALRRLDEIARRLERIAS